MRRTEGQEVQVTQEAEVKVLRRICMRKNHGRGRGKESLTGKSSKEERMARRRAGVWEEKR